MEVRADTYLWAIRMYKSRTLAGDAIRSGHVKLNKQNIKPSHSVKIGETYALTIGSHVRIIEVKALVEKRGSYEFAKRHYIDHTPVRDKDEKLPSAFFKVNIKREKGSGRPTKKERRDLEDFGW